MAGYTKMGELISGRIVKIFPLCYIGRVGCERPGWLIDIVEKTHDRLVARRAGECPAHVSKALPRLRSREQEARGGERQGQPPRLPALDGDEGHALSLLPPAGQAQRLPSRLLLYSVQ